MRPCKLLILAVFLLLTVISQCNMPRKRKVIDLHFCYGSPNCEDGVHGVASPTPSPWESVERAPGHILDYGEPIPYDDNVESADDEYAAQLDGHAAGDPNHPHHVVAADSVQVLASARHVVDGIDEDEQIQEWGIDADAEDIAYFGDLIADPEEQQPRMIYFNMGDDEEGKMF